MSLLYPARWLKDAPLQRVDHLRAAPQLRPHYSYPLHQLLSHAGIPGPSSLPALDHRWSDAQMGVSATPAGAPASENQARLVAVRHGTTAWSRTRRHTGRTDVPLEPEGVTQAIAVGRRLAGHDFTLVLTSPLTRARVTCELAGFGDSAQLCDDLVEWDYGDVDGRTTEEVRAVTPGWDIWRDGVGGGESLAEVSLRADKVIEAVRRRRGEVLVFAHAHILRVIAARWVGLEPEVGRIFTLDPATVSVLDWDRGSPVVSRWNEAVGETLF